MNFSWDGACMFWMRNLVKSRRSKGRQCTYFIIHDTFVASLGQMTETKYKYHEPLPILALGFAFLILLAPLAGVVNILYGKISFGPNFIGAVAVFLGLDFLLFRLIARQYKKIYVREGEIEIQRPWLFGDFKFKKVEVYHKDEIAAIYLNKAISYRARDVINIKLKSGKVAAASMLHDTIDSHGFLDGMKFVGCSVFVGK